VSEILIKEIRNVAVITLILGIIQVIITIPAGYFGYPSIIGTLLGCLVALFNFSVMGIILEKSISSTKGASGLMGFGYIARLAVIGAAVVWAMKVNYLNYLCVIIPLLFPQIAIFIINLTRKKEKEADKNEWT
jgi:hypothetical protein